MLRTHDVSLRMRLLSVPLAIAMVGAALIGSVLMVSLLFVRGVRDPERDGYQPFADDRPATAGASD